MSYIRCLSNPEALYIWGDGDGKVSISVAAEPILRMPTLTFHGLLRKFQENDIDADEVVTFKGATFTLEPTFRWALTYKDWGKKKIVLWETTVWYLITQNNFRWKKKNG